MKTTLKIEPQILILYNQNKEAVKIIFLSYNEVSSSDYVYGFYELNKTINNYNVEYQIIQDHIPLTYNLSELRGHISSILDIHENIIVFSAYNNIDYSYYNSSEIFDPFHIVNETSIHTNNDNEIIYNIYKNNLVQGAIYLVVKSKDVEFKNLGRFGTFVEKKKEIIYSVIKNIYENQYTSSVDVKNTNEYDLYCTLNLILKLVKYDKYKKTFNWNYKKDTYITGNKLILFEESDKDFQKVLKFQEDNGEEIFTISDTVLKIKDNEKFNEIIKDYSSYFFIKDKKKKTTVIISFETNLNTNINFDFYFDFFVELKKGTQNIFSDRSGNIQIIISKDHISFRSIDINISLSKYLTAFFLGYSNISNKVKKNRKDIKVNQLYTSRYCQNNKTSERKPRLIDLDSIVHDDYIKFNNQFYEGKTFNNIKIGDIYIDKENFCYKCFDNNYPHLSFVSNFVYATSDINKVVCIPCCFSKSKKDSDVFNRCITGETNDYDDNQSEYIQNYGRIITNKKKSTFLPIDIDLIFNKNSIIEYNIHKKIIHSKDYSIIRKNEEDIDPIENFSDLYSFTNNRDCIVIDENNIFINPNTLDKYFQNNIDIDVYIIIQKRIHVIKNISKDINRNKIKITNINKEKIDNLIMTYFKFLYNQKLIKRDSDNDIILNNNYYLYKNKRITLERNTALFKIPNINIEENSTSEIINKYYEKSLFKYIYSDKIENITKSIILNTQMNINKENKINNKEEIKMIIDKLDSIN